MNTTGEHGRMPAMDGLRFALRALEAARARTGLMTLAMAIGVAAVIVLTALGEGARNYVLREFSSMGSSVLTIIPGRSETTGGMPPTTGATPRDLTLDDALSLRRSALISGIAPIVIGDAEVSAGTRSRDVMVFGSTAELKSIRHLELAHGSFLPAGDPFASPAVCVLGETLKTELFGTGAAVGELVRIGDRRFRVIGVLASKGQSLGANIDDTAIIPVVAAQALFNTQSLFRVLVEVRGRESIPSAKRTIEALITARHEGENDITIVSLDAMLSTFDRIFTALTLTVAGIAAISLAVAGILIMNVMLIAVSQRTQEIGLLKALGAPPRIIVRLFLTEAALLSLLGAAAGVILAYAGIYALGRLFPDFAIGAPPWAVAAGVGVAVVTGVLFGWLPARRAARLDPVQALSRR